MSPGRRERRGQGAHVLQRRAPPALDPGADGAEADARRQQGDDTDDGELQMPQPHGERSVQASVAPLSERDAS